MNTMNNREHELTAGGGDTELLDPVFGAGSTEPSYDNTNPTGGFDQGGNGGSGGGQSGGTSGGAGNEGGNPAPTYQIHRHTTPSGGQFSVHVNLSAEQTAVASQIVDHGRANNIRNDYVAIAFRKAYHESSFNAILTNPTHFGLYQYSNDTWSIHHNAMNIHNVQDQIRAMFSDIEGYAARYRQGRESGQIPYELTFEHYVEYKHHFGANYDRWEPELLNGYNVSSDELGLNVD